MDALHLNLLAGVAVSALLASGCSCDRDEDALGDTEGEDVMTDSLGDGTEGDSLTLDSGNPKLDTEQDDDSASGGGSAEAGTEVCKLVDVILAVDNSQSMQEEIAALKGPVFDSFPTTLLDVGNGLENFQLAVIDACNQPPHFHNWGVPGDCNFSTGANYMVSSSGALTQEYACVTDFTTAGYNNVPDLCTGDNDDEQPANTAADAVTGMPGMNENAGFNRSDAVLFVVAITDEDEQPAPNQTAQEIADKLIASKGGVIENVVFLGIGGDTNCTGPYGSAEEASLLREITMIFSAAGRGLWWDLCAGDLEGAFQAALEVVDSACNDWVPPG